MEKVLKQFSFFVTQVIFASLISLGEAYASEIATSAFAKLALIESPKLSPDGEKVAFMGSHNARRYLMTASLDGEGGYTLLKRIDVDNRYISDYYWAANDRLILDVRGNQSRTNGVLAYSDLYSVGVDETSLASFRLVSYAKVSSGYFRPRIVSLLPNDSSHVLVHFGPTFVDGVFEDPVQIVDVYTGEAEVYAFAKANHGWVLDNEGRLRIFMERISYNLFTRMNIYHKSVDKKRWSRIARFKYLSKKSMEPYRFHEDDNNILLVTKYRDNGTYDAVIDETILPIYEYDIRKKKIIGPYKNVVQQRLKQFLAQSHPHLTHEIISYNNKQSLFVVKSFSDVVAPRYYIVDLSKQVVYLLANAFPELVDVDLSPMQKVSYAARDGLTIPAYLTLPLKQADRYPLIVLPHGGPFASDLWGFDNMVQFLANRGYAVFQPQFRGSTGFGYSLVTAGYGEWGGKMQTDISDGVAWLIDKGFIDEQRVCIIGGSFGGYSALFAAATEGQTYQCAIGINGVYDIKTFVKENGFGKRYKRKDVLGRPWFNSYKSLEKKSPYDLSDNISIPALLIAEKNDIVVSYNESKKLFEKMHQAGQVVEYLELDDGEHWRTDSKNEIAIYSAVEKFLEKTIGK